jgi:hypothetical protein
MAKKMERRGINPAIPPKSRIRNLKVLVNGTFIGNG